MLENWKEIYKIERIRKDKTKYKSVGRWAWENGKAVKTAWKSREENSQARQIERAEKRNHRLITRGAMLESFIENAEELTNEDIKILLKVAFNTSDIKETLSIIRESWARRNNIIVP